MNFFAYFLTFPGTRFVSPVQNPRHRSECKQAVNRIYKTRPVEARVCALLPLWGSGRGGIIGAQREREGGGGRWCRRLRPSTAFFSGRPDQRPAQSPTLISAQKHNCSDCKGIGHEGDCCFSNSKCYIFFFFPPSPL